MTLLFSKQYDHDYSSSGCRWDIRSCFYWVDGNKNSTKAVQLTTGIGVGQALIFPDTSQEEDQQSFNSTLCFYINITWTRKRIEKQLYISFILLYGALLFSLPSSYCQNNLFNFKLFKTLIILFWGGVFFYVFLIPPKVCSKSVSRRLERAIFLLWCGMLDNPVAWWVKSQASRWQWASHQLPIEICKIIHRLIAEICNCAINYDCQRRQ